jgi:hypothetical protein
MRAVGGGLFNPQAFYGRETIVSLSAGVRLEWRMAGHRMGRYGELLPPTAEWEAGGHAHEM